jgi:hypothetical protein
MMIIINPKLEGITGNKVRAKESSVGYGFKSQPQEWFHNCRQVICYKIISNKFKLGRDHEVNN